MATNELRYAVVRECYQWLGTPYRSGAMAKGIACDSATLILGIMQAVGLARDERLEVYSTDAWQQWSEERCLFWLLRHARRTTESVAAPGLVAQPGDIVLTCAKRSRHYNHAGIVIAWPKIIHAIHPAVEMCYATRHWFWAYNRCSVFDPYVDRPALEMLTPQI
jgi:cell wall-associated NlpC family hydrolase